MRIAMNLLLLLVVGCNAAPSKRPDQPGRAGVTFAQEATGAGEMCVRYRWGPAVTPAGLAFSIGAHSAKLTVAEGMVYFAQRDRQTTGEREGLVYVDMFQSPPEGHTAVRPGEAASVLDLLGNVHNRVVQHAPSMVAGLAAGGTGVRPGAAQLAADPILAPGQGWVRELILEDPRLGEVRSLTWFPSQQSGRSGLCVAGQQMALWLDEAGVVQDHVAFTPPTTHPIPVDVEGDGIFEYMDAGGGWQSVGLRDARGAVIWTYPQGTLSGLFSATPDGMACGDLDGDGTLEFVSGMNSRGGLFVFDDDGTVLQRHDAVNVFSVGVLDVDGDGAVEIVHSDQGGLAVRAADGTPMDAPLPSFTSFSVVTDMYGDPALGQIRGDHALLTEPDGTVAGRFPVKPSGHKDISVAWVPMGGGEQAVAIARTIGASNGQSELYIFTAGGKPLHHEIIPAAHTVVAASPEVPGGPHSLVVAAGPRLWRYHPAR